MILQQMVKKQEFQKNVDLASANLRVLINTILNQNNRELFKNFDELIQIILKVCIPVHVYSKGFHHGNLLCQM